MTTKRVRVDTKSVSLLQLKSSVPMNPNDECDSYDDGCDMDEMEQGYISIAPLAPAPAVIHPPHLNDETTACLLCELRFGNTDVEGESETVTRMQELYNDGKNVPHVNMCNMLADVYLAMQPETQLSRKSLAKEFYTHLTEHTIDPYRDTKEDIRILSVQMAKLKANAWPDGQLDERVYDRLLRTLAAKQNSQLILQRFA